MKRSSEFGIRSSELNENVPYIVGADALVGPLPGGPSQLIENVHSTRRGGACPVRRWNPENIDPPGESVRPGGDPRGDRPSWAFQLGWVSGGEETAIFPSRVSFLFGSFSLDKQRERSSVPPRVFAKAPGKSRPYRAGGGKPRPYELNARFRSIETGRRGAGRRGRRPLRHNGTFLHNSELRTPNSELSRASAPTENRGRRAIRESPLR